MNAASAAPGPAPDIVIDVRGINKHFGDKHVVKDLSLNVRARRDLRLSRSQRQRQDDVDPHALRAAHARQRRGHMPRLRHPARDQGDQASRRLHDAALLVLGRPHHPREPALHRAHVRHGRRRASRRAGARAPGTGGARGSARGRRCRAAGSSAWRSPRACCTSRSCCCSTSRPPASIPRRAAISGRSCTASPRAASRCWSARTTWTKPSAATSSATSSTAGCWCSGTAQEVIASQTLVTWEVSGDDLAALAETPARLPGVEQVAAFGTTLHVTGPDRAQARRGAGAANGRRGPHVARSRSLAWRTCSSI